MRVSVHSLRQQQVVWSVLTLVSAGPKAHASNSNIRQERQSCMFSCSLSSFCGQGDHYQPPKYAHWNFLCLRIASEDIHTLSHAPFTAHQTSDCRPTGVHGCKSIVAFASSMLLSDALYQPSQVQWGVRILPRQQHPQRSPEHSCTSCMLEIISERFQAGSALQ
jgi:hypothetical protein